MAGVIAFVLGNFTLTFFVLGLIASAIALAFKTKRTFPVVVEALFSYFLLFSIAVSYFYNFVFHVFFGEMAARFIGWANSPFQLEVGFASLGFAVLGLLAFKGSRDMRIAAIVGPTCFLWGAAGGHIYQMITQGNFAPGNAGIMLYSDFLLPIIGLLFLWLQRDPELRPVRLNVCVLGSVVLRTKREQSRGEPRGDLPLWKSGAARGSSGDLSRRLGLGCRRRNRPADCGAQAMSASR